MTREQAINYLISSGFSEEQVSEVVRALTYEPTTKNNLGVDCINKADFVKKLESETIGLQSWQKALIYQVMDDCHSVTPQELCDKCEVGNPCLYCKHEFEAKTGHWITKPHVYGVTYCSKCDFELRIDNTNYCPNCGAKMVEPQKRSDKECI